MIEKILKLNPKKEIIINEKRWVDRCRRVLLRQQKKLEHEKNIILLKIKKNGNIRKIRKCKNIGKGYKVLH